MYGFQATGKSTIANIIAQGIGALTAEDIEIIDDKEYDDYREGRMERLPQKDNPKVVIFLGLGKEMFKLREPSDINILVTADEQTIGRNMYQRRTGRDAEADMTPGLQAEIKRVVAVVRAEYRKLEDRRTRPDFTLNMNSNRRPSEDEIAAIFGDSDKLKQENIQQLQQLKRLLLTKSAEIAGARPLVLRIIGVGDSGKSVFAQALREGLSDVWRDGIYLYDDPDIVRLQQGRRYSKRYLLNEHPQARLVIAAGLIGIELLTEDDADINVFLEVDEETLKANFIEKHRNFPRQKLDMLLRAEGMISGLGRKATLEELCAGAFEDEDFDQEMSAIAPEKIDFKFNLSEGYRLTPAEIEACLRQAVFPEAALDKDSAEAIALSL